jgi:ribosomal protein S18 acetylase RimI-like enzyme
MEILHVNSQNKCILLQFLDNKLPSTFRYFSNRNVDCIRNHEITIIGIIDSVPIAYGHIDKDENNTYWLGVCILQEHQNKGYGQYIIRYLLKNSKSKLICLTVDKANNTAIHLYERFGFKIIKEFDTYYKMCLNKE